MIPEDDILQIEQALFHMNSQSLQLTLILQVAIIPFPVSQYPLLSKNDFQVTEISFWICSQRFVSSFKSPCVSNLPSGKHTKS